jgi:hypothetical protein
MGRLPKPPPVGKDLFGGVRLTEQEEKCWEWDQAHPHVWNLFVRMAEQAIQNKQKRWSARDILAAMRWNAMVRGEKRKYACNNNVTPWFARKWELLGLHPEVPGFFQKRRAPRTEREIVEGARKRGKDAGRAGEAGRESPEAHP